MTMFASRIMLQKCDTTRIDLNCTNIQCSDIIKYLGAWLDQHLQLIHNITLKCRTAMINFQKIQLIQLVLNIDVTHTLVRCLVTSHLDYYNVIFCGLPEYLLDLLQKVQNAAAKLVLGMKKYDRATVALRRLHWLSIRARIDFKILTLIHKCLSGNASGYLTDILVPLTMNHEGLRSNNSVRCLAIPRTYQKTFADQAFSVYGPKKWNNLPDELRVIEDLDHFKARLKTVLYNTLYT